MAAAGEAEQQTLRMQGVSSTDLLGSRGEHVKSEMNSDVVNREVRGGPIPLYFLNA